MLYLHLLPIKTQYQSEELSIHVTLFQGVLRLPSVILFQKGESWQYLYAFEVSCFIYVIVYYTSGLLRYQPLGKLSLSAEDIPKQVWKALPQSMFTKISPLLLFFNYQDQRWLHLKQRFCFLIQRMINKGKINQQYKVVFFCQFWHQINHTECSEQRGVR